MGPYSLKKIDGMLEKSVPENFLELMIEEALDKIYYPSKNIVEKLDESSYFFRSTLGPKTESYLLEIFKENPRSVFRITSLRAESLDDYLKGFEKKSFDVWHSRDALEYKIRNPVSVNRIKSQKTIFHCSDYEDYLYQFKEELRELSE